MPIYIAHTRAGAVYWHGVGDTVYYCGRHAESLVENKQSSLHAIFLLSN